MHGSGVAGLENSKLKILLIDDKESITQMMEKYLTAKGHKCEISNDGRKGLSLILENKYDTILLDLAMPDFTGVDIVEHLWNDGTIKDRKIILFTASSIKDSEIDGLLKKGVRACLKKPVKLATLLEAIGG